MDLVLALEPATAAAIVDPLWSIRYPHCPLPPNDPFRPSNSPFCTTLLVAHVTNAHSGGHGDRLLADRYKVDAGGTSIAKDLSIETIVMVPTKDR
jgi:hypothetical protein